MNTAQAAFEKSLKKIAFRLYKKHITGRGYVWPIECSMPDDVQSAIIEGMREAIIRAIPDGYVVVPKEPTAEMGLAGAAADYEAEMKAKGDNIILARADAADMVYRAMISAGQVKEQSE